MSTHLEAAAGAIAPDILLPGDPKRAQFIAEKYLTDPVCYNHVRGMLGFTGTYGGKRISVQGTGMGIPSISIYTHELLAQYGVKRLIRVGTCGALSPALSLRETLLVLSASTDSAANAGRFSPISYAPTADFALARSAFNAAEKAGISLRVGQVYTSDLFYDENVLQKAELLAKYGVLGVEMESAELFTLAARFGARALSLLTVSDHLITGEQTTAQERETTFDPMIRLALDTLRDFKEP